MGRFSSNEWVHAANISTSVTGASDPLSAEGTVWVADDGLSLFIGLKIPEVNSSNASMNLMFDNNHDGVIQQGEDVLLYFPQLGGAHIDFHVYDFAGTGGIDLSEDIITDGQAAVSWDGAFIYFEFSHPLCSGDSNDLCASPGYVVEFEIQYITSQSTGYWPQPFLENGTAASLYGDIEIAPNPNHSPMDSSSLFWPAIAATAAVVLAYELVRRRVTKA